MVWKWRASLVVRNFAKKRPIGIIKGNPRTQPGGFTSASTVCMVLMHVCGHEHPVRINEPHGLEGSRKYVLRQSLLLVTNRYCNNLDVPTAMVQRGEERDSDGNRVKCRDRDQGTDSSR